MLTDVRSDSPLTRVLAPKTSGSIQKAFGYTTVKELLDHFPRQYMPHDEHSEFSQLRVGDYTTFVARVRSTTQCELRSKRQKVVYVVVEGADHDTLTMGF